MSTPTIMIIRHGEKPFYKKHKNGHKEYKGYKGIDIHGSEEQDNQHNSLIPQGWMRCGSLIRFFYPLSPNSHTSGIASPTHLYATASKNTCHKMLCYYDPLKNPQPPPQPHINTEDTIGTPTKSLREQELLLGLSAYKQLMIDARFAVGKQPQSEMAKHLKKKLKSSDVALIAWEHDHIPELASEIMKRFNMGTSFPLTKTSKHSAQWPSHRFDIVWVFYCVDDKWSFNQIPQMLCPGDSYDLIPGPNTYRITNSWGETDDQFAGNWVLGNRLYQNIESLNISSSDSGKSYQGTMKYSDEGPIKVNANRLSDSNTFVVMNSWGGTDGHFAGYWTIGYRMPNQYVCDLDIKEDKDGILKGTMKYNGEGPIGFKGVRLKAHEPKPK